MSNIKWIWWVAGLMIIAIAGIVWMQVNWIRENIKVVEDQFDTEVYSALNSVKQEIEDRFYGNDRRPQLSHILGQRHLQDSTVTKWSDLFSEAELDQIRESQIDLEKLKNLVESAFINKMGADGLKSQRITDLINLEKLDNSIRNNLRSRGIKTDYHYGILSNQDGNIVIMDGNFVVFPEEDIEATITEHNHKLKNSPYATNLFIHNNNRALGKLIIEFPMRTRFIISRILTNIILSVIFIAITLFSFLYTIFTILRQKRIAEMKTDFINNMTHEFKTPIATISLATDSIQNPNIVKSPEKVERFANIIKEENKRMLVQVEKVLQMAQFNNKRLKMAMEYVDVHQLLTQAKNHIELQVKRRGGRITIDLGAPTHIIKGDENHLSNIFHNLLDNANKYTPEEPLIQIRSKAGNGGIIIEIEDNGQGMNREQVKNIFEKFYRIHTGDIHDIKGFGLGLSYVKAMVDAHHGQIHVDSRLGKGSVFQLFFPYPKEK
ncbi:HAMP domain-containing histidine kinase [Membranicola marinus]|uniref:histidine kinase n=1 Tax=Membranihabitans marinus TaxID=1227546 RepID=A0A953L7T8_9BACT|nr:HAMP domain-containing sensor histidine kinase [Membranihabitans marinus]MBY5956970.1 HAMP domain-containing histidine kinase [Membranihabitans marinus]